MPPTVFYYLHKIEDWAIPCYSDILLDMLDEYGLEGHLLIYLPLPVIRAFWKVLKYRILLRDEQLSEYDNTDDESD